MKIVDDYGKFVKDVCKHLEELVEPRVKRAVERVEAQLNLRLRKMEEAIERRFCTSELVVRVSGDDVNAVAEALAKKLRKE